MRVAVIAGGTSREAEVSRRSANEAANALRAKHDCEVFEYDGSLTTKLLDYNPHVAFPVMHGSPGEDGTVQGYLSVLQIPFVGSGVEASAIAMDKFGSKCIWQNAGIPVLPSQRIDVESFSDSVVQRIHDAFGERVAIKPRDQGSALGVQLLPNGGDIRSSIEAAFEYGDHLIVEPFVEGREITVGVLEAPLGSCISLPIIEIHVTVEGAWYDYTNRYTPGGSRHEINPRFADGIAEKLGEYAVLAHELLRCRDLSRADFLVTEASEIWLLELNTIPGLTRTSLYPDAAKAYGMEMVELMDSLVANAHTRGNKLR